MELRGNQVARILNTIQILYSKKHGITAKELSETSDISLKTAYRDITAIESSGFPIYTENRLGTTYFRLMDGFKQEFPLTFSFDELMAIYYAKDLFKIFEGTSLHSSLENIIKKIKNIVPNQAVDFLNNLENSFNIATGQKFLYSRKKEFISKINTCIAQRKAIEIDYEGSNNKSSKRQIDPYTLYISRGLIYLIGFCHLRKSIRIFAVTRIQNVKTLTDSFSIPEDFDVKTYFDGSFNVYRGDKEIVTILFSNEVSPFIKERVFHESQTTKETDEGIQITLEIAITPDFKTFLMSWGKDIKILSPSKLKQEIRERHKLASEYV